LALTAVNAPLGVIRAQNGMERLACELAVDYLNGGVGAASADAGANFDSRALLRRAAALIPSHASLVAELRGSVVKYSIFPETYFDTYYRGFAEKRAAEVVRSEIKPGMSAVGKVRAIHDWIVLNNEYSTDWNVMDKYSGVSTFYYKTSVCSGYARAFKMMCDAAGIPSLYIEGAIGSGPHAWNAVFVDGRWFYVDTTLDDLDNGAVRNDYFMLPASEPLPGHYEDAGMPFSEYIAFGNYYYFAYLPSLTESAPASAPKITSHPTSKTVRPLARATLSVAAEDAGGLGELTYQWYENSSGAYRAIKGAVSPALTVSTAAEGAASYYCAVVGASGVKKLTKIATVIVTGAATTDYDAKDPVIIDHPAISFRDGSAYLTVRANSPDGGSLSYQWYRLESDGWKPMKNASERALKVLYRGSYYCVVTNTNPNAFGDEAASGGSKIIET
jgi:hypothetical protein